MNWSTIRFLILDVDGVLTDGQLALDRDGEPFKTFHVRDGAALQRWRASGGDVAILSGRRSAAVDARAAELGITRVCQGVSATGKGDAFDGLIRSAGVAPGQTCYIGDDEPDLPALRRCGFAVAVANAAEKVKQAAMYVTRRPGGQGAVAEVVDLLLGKRGRTGAEGDA